MSRPGRKAAEAATEGGADVPAPERADGPPIPLGTGSRPAQPAQAAGPTAGPAAGLTPAEDAELRRLNFLARMATLNRRVDQRLDELVERDRRTFVREPVAEESSLPIEHR